MPAAGDQSLGLREKLDLADAAVLDLDVVSLDGNLALPAKRLHPPLHLVDVGERREIQVLAPDQRRDTASNASPALASPAQARALIIAARSQVRPSRS